MLDMYLLSVWTLTPFSSYIFKFFGSAGLRQDTCSMLLDQCAKAITFLTTDPHSVHRNGNNIQKFVDAVKVRKSLKILAYQ